MNIVLRMGDKCVGRDGPNWVLATWKKAEKKGKVLFEGEKGVWASKLYYSNALEMLARLSDRLFDYRNCDESLAAFTVELARCREEAKAVREAIEGGKGGLN